MDDIRDLTERIRKAEARRQTKLLTRPPREADIGEGETVGYPVAGGYALAIKVRGKLHTLLGGGAAAAAPSGGSATVVVNEAAADPLPDQAGHAGEYLTTDGSEASWAAFAEGTGTIDLGGIADGGTGSFDMGAIA